MDDSSSQEHFHGKFPQRPAVIATAPPTQPPSQKPLSDSDGGFNDDQESDPFKQEPQKKQQQESVVPAPRTHEMKRSKKHKRLKQRRFKEEDSNSYRNNSEEDDQDEPEPKAKMKRKKEIKKSEAPRKRQPTRPKEESKKEIERRQMEEVFKGVAERLIEELNKRCEADRQLYEEKKPALEKLQYLSELTTKLQNKYVQAFFLEADGLEALQNWLKKYPDGQQPSYTVRKRLLQIILSLPARSRHISKAQQLATIIQKYKKSTNPTNRELKVISEKIVFKWQNICNFDERERMT